MLALHINKHIHETDSNTFHYSNSAGTSGPQTVGTVTQGEPTTISGIISLTASIRNATKISKIVENHAMIKLKNSNY